MSAIAKDDGHEAQGTYLCRGMVVKLNELLQTNYLSLRKLDALVPVDDFGNELEYVLQALELTRNEPRNSRVMSLLVRNLEQCNQIINTLQNSLISLHASDDAKVRIRARSAVESLLEKITVISTFTDFIGGDEAVGKSSNVPPVETGTAHVPTSSSPSSSNVSGKSEHSDSKSPTTGIYQPHTGSADRRTPGKEPRGKDAPQGHPPVGLDPDGVRGQESDEHARLVSSQDSHANTPATDPQSGNGQEAPLESRLYVAASAGQVRTVQKLIEAGEASGLTGGHYSRALVGAASNGHKDVVRLVLLTGLADLDAQDAAHGTALYAASMRGHHEVVQMLLENNADVNVRSVSHGNALHVASYNGHEAVVRLLLESGKADISARDDRNETALHVAASNGRTKVVQLLLESKADVNAQSYRFGNALQGAAAHGHEEVVHMLLERNTDVNAQNGEHGNALQAASVNGYSEVIQTLLKYGAHVNAQGPDAGNALQSASEGGHLEAVQTLLRAGADVNTQGGRYGNALQAASVNGHQDVVGILLQAGAYVNARGGEYSTALQAAGSGRHVEVVDILLKAGAEVENAAITAAGQRNYDDVVKMLDQAQNKRETKDVPRLGWRDIALALTLKAKAWYLRIKDQYALAERNWTSRQS